MDWSKFIGQAGIYALHIFASPKIPTGFALMYILARSSKKAGKNETFEDGITIYKIYLDSPEK